MSSHECNNFTNRSKNPFRFILSGGLMTAFGFTVLLAQEITVSDSLINAAMSPDMFQSGEVVVTALGVERAKREIPYAAQNVETGNISRARELNVVNSLQGRVAGMDLIRSSSGLGSATRVILRGNRSITGNNQPLYILDGVPIQNSYWGTPDSERGGIQGGDGISNINPDDVASITVLKGPNAAALYGSRAANGTIVITTRRSVARKGIGVEFNTNSSMDKALILSKYQHVYGQGWRGDYYPNSEMSWGPKMDGQLVDHWSPDPNFEGPAQYAFNPHHNFEEFFGTGYNLANTLTLTSGNEKVRTLFSYTNTNAKGIVETNKLRRNNLNIRIDGNLSPKLSFDTRLTYFNQSVDNRLATGDDSNNPMRAIYLQPGNISLEQARQFEYFDDAGMRRQHYWNPHTNGGENIYWMLNRTIRAEERNRVMGMASLRYQFTEGLSLMIRSAFDQIFENQSYKQYNDTYTIAYKGNLSLDDRYAMEMNNDFLMNYNHLFGNLLSLDVSLGGNMLYMRNESLNTRTNGLLKPNLFSITNTSEIRSTQNGSEKKIHSLYGIATIGFKNFLFLDVTGRNDWSSTLPPDNWSYFYPSVGLTWILTDMLESTPEFLSFAKLRASYAEVGNDTSPYAIHNTYSFGSGGALGYARRSSIQGAKDLKPENTKSIELGFDIRLFRNRVGVDFTWYRSNTFNQLLRVPIPLASGYSFKYINAGNIQNQGVQIILNTTPLMMGDFRWDLTFNYARNENLCIELTDELTEYTTRGRSYFTTYKMVEGEAYNQFFTRGFLRNDADRILINSLGWPVTTPGQTVPMGSANPDWTGGLSNSFSWKGFNLSALIDMRMGGEVFSITEFYLRFEGLSEATLEGREGFVVDGVMESDGSENTIEVTAEAYWMSVGGRSTPVGEPGRFDASYVRLREVLVGYTWNLQTSAIQSIALSLYGRNLGFLYNASGIIDPGMSIGVGNIQGMEGFSIPTSKTYGVNARFKF